MTEQRGGPTLRRVGNSSMLTYTRAQKLDRVLHWPIYTTSISPRMICNGIDSYLRSTLWGRDAEELDSPLSKGDDRVRLPGNSTCSTGTADG